MVQSVISIQEIAQDAKMITTAIKGPGASSQVILVNAFSRIQDPMMETLDLKAKTPRMLKSLYMITVWT